MSRLAHALGVAASVVTVAATVVSTAVAWTGWADLVFAASFCALGIACGLTGGIVAARVPGNAVGWLILAIGLGTGVLLATGAYAEAGVDTSLGPLPGQSAAAWTSQTLSVPVTFGLTGFLLLLFPTGHLPSPRWRAWAWIFGLVVGLATVSYGLLPGTLDQGIPNPVELSDAAASTAEAVAAFTDWAGPPAMVLCAVALGVRMRHSHGVERQQLKWFTYAAAVAGCSLGLTILAFGVLADVAFLLSMLGLIMLPVSAGMAILRHRLYDIDVVIKRTLVYGSLTAALLATYLVLVLTLQPLLRPVTGESSLAVAASTLAVAALFRPLRSAIQHVVDRRFFRSRYDAVRTLDEFSGRLRNELDLDSLGADLRAVVHDAMQPAHVSLWLREVPR